jgi:hypothetical protein
MTRETVARETPAWVATSAMVTLAFSRDRAMNSPLSPRPDPGLRRSPVGLIQ